MKYIQKQLSKVVKEVARSVAVLSANSTCMYYAYQPKMPKTVIQLRKN